MIKQTFRRALLIIKIIVKCQLCFLLLCHFYYELGIFYFNSYVYCLTRGFIASTHVFNLLTCAFSLPNRAFSLTTHAFNLATRAFSVLTCRFKLITRRFYLATCRFELVTRRFVPITRGFELENRTLLFHFIRIPIKITFLLLIYHHAKVFFTT